MKKILLFVTMTLSGVAAFCTTWDVTNSGTTFTPASITIALGDVVNFSLGSNHNAVEVSKATWDARGNTALSGGFSTPYGGGIVSADKLTAGIHYYVCQPHASIGMKGMITVLNPTGLSDNQAKEVISVIPNPSNGNFRLQINAPQSAKKLDLGIYTVLGGKVYSKTDVQQQDNSTLEIADFPKGIYFVRLSGGKENLYKKIVVQ